MKVEAKYVDEECLRSKVMIQLVSLEDLNMVANHYTECIEKCSTPDKGKTSYCLILPDKCHIHTENNY